MRRRIDERVTADVGIWPIFGILIASCTLSVNISDNTITVRENNQATDEPPPAAVSL
jgi:hypothetical protein